MRKINKVTVLKPIPIKGIERPMPVFSRIELDKSYPVAKREHQVIFQQGAYYGEVGDRCYYISQEELLKLEADGIVRLG